MAASLYSKELLLHCLVLALCTAFSSLHAFKPPLTLDYYKKACPTVLEIVRKEMECAVLSDPRNAALILRLHFHDCFVQGCDGSVLLDDTVTLQGEKKAPNNIHALKGFRIIDSIKNRLESECPGTVSCADILTIAARDAVILVGGPYWDVPLGRKDSKTAGYALVETNIPTADDGLLSIISNFISQGLSVTDMVALSGKRRRLSKHHRRMQEPVRPTMAQVESIISFVITSQLESSKIPPRKSLRIDQFSKSKRDQFLSYFVLLRFSNYVVAGAHTIGMARCVNFRNRIYGDFPMTSGINPLSQQYLSKLKSVCPPVKGSSDNNESAMDNVTPNLFDNSYYHILLRGEGLINSDQEMYSSVLAVETKNLVTKYAENPVAFFEQFSQSMVKMGNIINPETYVNGEVRKNCRFVNT